MTARCVMVLGTSSGAGKSWVATALCRWYARQGLKVAPFKAKDMSDNARVVAPTLATSSAALPAEGAALVLAAAQRKTMSGGEIGSAQYFQALAACAVPDVRMNPLLLKPERDTHSQVVLMGQVSDELSALPWRSRSERVWPQIAQALDELRAENDVVVIEGAGSPADINLMDSDIVNLRVARLAQARCLLVTDVDRGGAFAHLYGSWALLPESDRALLCGFVLNKFRGDAALLAPGRRRLRELTGVPTLATLPMRWRHGLPEEDGVFGVSVGSGAAPALPSPGEASIRTIAVIAYPCISNLDEFQLLQNLPGVRLIWARSSADVVGADWVILPGSKHTSDDLAWLRAHGLGGAIAAHAAQGGAVLGICGGLQMLGEALIDPHSIEGNGAGLGLLPVATLFEHDKTVRHRTAAFSTLSGAWAALSGVAVQGYEIHHGQTAEHPAMAAVGQHAHAVMQDGLAWQNDAGNVLGIYLHGLFEDAGALRALFGASVPTLDAMFDGLADFIDRHFQPGVLQALVA